MSSKRQDVIRGLLEKIRAENKGRLTPEAVVRVAQRNKTSPLGKMFDWNVERAAKKHWEDRAREIISRYITVETIHESKVIVSPYYVRDPGAVSNEQGYTTTAQLDRKQSVQVLLNELDRCESCIERARSIADAMDSKHTGLSAQFEQMLVAIVKSRQVLQAA